MVVMKHIISLSGGIGSYFTLKRVIESRVSIEDIECIFCDTLNENGDLYRFLDDIEKKFNIKITRLCVGKTPYQLSWEENFLYNSRVANCSKILKSKPFKEYIKKYEPNDIILYFGIDFTESHRTNAIIKNYAPIECKFPMCEKPYLYKNEMLDLLKQDGIEVPNLYKQGFSHNNCNGCCVKAGIGHYKLLLETDRDKFIEMENFEQRMREKLNKNVSILKRNGKPFTLKELREIVDNEPKQLSLCELQDIGGCACFIEE